MIPSTVRRTGVSTGKEGGRHERLLITESQLAQVVTIGVGIRMRPRTLAERMFGMLEREVAGDPRPNYYELLEIEEGASDAQIEQAFRRQAAKWHPDRFHQDPDAQPAAEARFRELRAAMDVLRDPTKRALYDAER